MAEGTYEYECMRAELLGLDQPDYETFLANQKEKAVVEEEETENELLKDADDQEEATGRIQGGLHDITSILSITQKKLNTFKTACGSLTNLLKIKVGQHGSNDSLNNQNPNQEGSSTDAATTNGHGGGLPSSSAIGALENGVAESSERASDLSRALDRNVDKLDSLIMTAENAEYSLKHQTKQMRGLLK